MSDFLAGLLVVVWVLSWWGPRRFRLWLVMLAPFGSVALIVAAYLSVPAGSCDHGCVLGWADNVDSSQSLAAALPTFPASIVIAVLTLPVELILFLRRNPIGWAPVDEFGEDAASRTPNDSSPASTATDQTPTGPVDQEPTQPAGHAPSWTPADQVPQRPVDHTPSWTPADQEPSWGDLTRRPRRSERKPTE